MEATRNWDGKKFIPKSQLSVIRSAMLVSEERKHFSGLLQELTKTVNSMTVTYEQDGKGDEAVAYLHYFSPGCDWYITEADMEDGTTQAFGFADMGCGGEFGYISINQLVMHPEVNLNFYWKPKTIAAIKKN